MVEGIDRLPHKSPEKQQRHLGKKGWLRVTAMYRQLADSED